MALPLYDGSNYVLKRESLELQRSFKEVKNGKVYAGWEMRVPERGADGVPFQFIFIGPTAEHRGSAIRMHMSARSGALPEDAEVLLETFYKTGSERQVVFQGPYRMFRKIPDQYAHNAALSAQNRAEAGEDYFIRLGVIVPESAPQPDPEADDSFFEVECLKLWWNETA